MMKTTCLKLKLSPQDVLKQDRRQDYYFGKKLKINDNEKELSGLNFVKFLISLTTALILDMVFWDCNSKRLVKQKDPWT